MTKFQKVIEWFGTHPNGTRKQAALAVGCSPALVAAVVRSGEAGDAGQRHTKIDACREFWAKHPSSSRRETAAAVGCTIQLAGWVARQYGFPKGSVARTVPVTRDGRCDHERKRKARTGTCKICPPVAAKVAA